MRLALTKDGIIRQVTKDFGRGKPSDSNVLAVVETVGFAGGEAEAREHLEEMRRRWQEKEK